MSPPVFPIGSTMREDTVEGSSCLTTFSTMVAQRARRIVGIRGHNGSDNTLEETL